MLDRDTLVLLLLVTTIAALALVLRLALRWLRAFDQRFAEAAAGHRIFTRGRFARYLLAGVAFGLAEFLAKGNVNDASLLLLGIGTLLVIQGLYQDIRRAPFVYFVVGACLQLLLFGPVLLMGPAIAVPLVCGVTFLGMALAPGNSAGAQSRELQDRIAQSRMGRGGVQLEYRDD